MGNCENVAMDWCFVSALQNDDLTRRLDNWGRWARLKPHHRAQCGSLEGNWRSPQCWHKPEGTWAGPIDELDAGVVQDAWKTMSWVPKMILKYKYIWRERAKLTCKRLGIHWRGYDDHLYYARMMISGRLGLKFHERRLTEVA